APIPDLLRDLPRQCRAQRIAALTEHYQQRRSAPENAPEPIEVARSLVEFRLDLGRAFEFALAVPRRARAGLAIVVQNFLAPGVVRRLVVEIREHRLDAVEHAPPLQRPLDKRIAPIDFGRDRRLEDHRLEQHRALDQILPLACERSDRRRARRMPDRTHTRPAHRRYEAFEVAHRRVPRIHAVGYRRTVAMPALVVAVNMA